MAICIETALCAAQVVSGYLAEESYIFCSNVRRIKADFEEPATCVVAGFTKICWDSEWLGAHSD